MYIRFDLTSFDLIYISFTFSSNEVKSSQIKSYIHILETENGNKDKDHSIIVKIIMINVVNYIDEKEEEVQYKSNQV